MMLRLPWLYSRKRLLAAVVIDAGLFSFLYIVAFMFRFRALPGISLPIGTMIAFWLLSSYVVGRYHAAHSVLSAEVIKSFLGTGLVLFLSLGVYLAYFWLTSSVLGVHDSRGFLVPLLILFSFISVISQAVLSQIIRSNIQSLQHWLFLGAPATLGIINAHLAWRRLLVDITLAADVNHVIDGGALAGYNGLLVTDFNSVSTDQQKKLLSLQQIGVPVLSLVGWCEQVLQRFPPELLTDADLLRGEFSFARGTIQKRFKRLGDVIFSCCLLVLTAPILVIAAVLIGLQDGGPVLYSQLRSGLDGRPFRIWKLRTMCVDAERQGAQWVSKRDSRITPVGHLLRLTRLDELPQLWAVLKGEMSLIGPRPERPEFEQVLERQLPHYRLRHVMRPGLSGWAQVNYPYGASLEDAANKLSYDLYYLRNFSFWLDLLILFKTIRLVFTAQGALPISEESVKP